MSALVTDVVMLSEVQPSSEAALRLGFLQLELRRIERELRGEQASGDVSLQTRLYHEREGIRGQMAEAMAETV